MTLAMGVAACRATNILLTINASKLRRCLRLARVRMSFKMELLVSVLLEHLTSVDNARHVLLELFSMELPANSQLVLPTLLSVRKVDPANVIRAL